MVEWCYLGPSDYAKKSSLVVKEVAAGRNSSLVVKEVSAAWKSSLVVKEVSVARKSSLVVKVVVPNGAQRAEVLNAAERGVADDVLDEE